MDESAPLSFAPVGRSVTWRAHNWVDPQKRELAEVQPAWWGNPACHWSRIEPWLEVEEKEDVTEAALLSKVILKWHWAFGSGSSYLCVRGGGRKQKWWVTNWPHARSHFSLVDPEFCGVTSMMGRRGRKKGQIR